VIASEKIVLIFIWYSVWQD